MFDIRRNSGTIKTAKKGGQKNLSKKQEPLPARETTSQNLGKPQKNAEKRNLLDAQ